MSGRSELVIEQHQPRRTQRPTWLKQWAKRQTESGATSRESTGNQTTFRGRVMGNRIVVQSVDFGECGEKYVSFAVDYSPAEAPRGMSGPWEDSSPGNSSECEVTGATLDGHDIFWMFDAEALRLIAVSVCEELDGEDADIDEPEDCDDAPDYEPDYEDRWAA